MRGKHRIAALAAIAAGVAGAAAPARAAQSEHWACSATPLQVLGTTFGHLGSAVACGDASGALLSTPMARGLTASTALSHVGLGSEAVASSAIARLDATVPSGPTISARALSATAATSCELYRDGLPGPSVATAGRSEVHDLRIGGRPVSGDPGHSARISVTPLVTAYLNRTLATPAGVVQRALEVQVLGTTYLIAGQAATAMRSDLGCAEGPEIDPPPVPETGGGS